MAKRSKSPTPTTVTIAPELGMDFSGPAAGIPDNALRLSHNGYYPPSSRKWRSRPGVSCVLTEENKFGGAIQVMRPHYNGTTTYLIVVANGHVYHISSALLAGSAASRIPTLIGSVSSTTVKPCLLSYNSRLFIADRGYSKLRQWTAAGMYGDVTNGPPYPSSLVEAKNRLWSNSTTDKDGIYGSPVEWTGSTWNVTGSGYVFLRAGYGDSMSVVGLCNGVGGKGDIIIAKRNIDQGGASMRRLNVSDATPGNWFVTDQFGSTAAQDNHYAMVQAYNDLLFVSDDGLFNLAAVQAYDELQIGSLGEKINPLIKGYSAVNVEEVTQAPLLGGVFMLMKDRATFYLYTPWNKAFTQWAFGNEIVTSVCTLGSQTYFGTSAGRIYALNEDTETSVSVGSDELSYGTLTEFNSIFRTKSFTFGGYEAAVRRCSALVVPLTAGTGSVHSVDEQGNTAPIFSWTQNDTALRIGGVVCATEPIGGSLAATTPIGRGTGAPEYIKEYGGPRTETLSFQLSISGGGRAEVQYFSADIRANLGGG